LQGLFRPTGKNVACSLSPSFLFFSYRANMAVGFPPPHPAPSLFSHAPPSVFLSSSLSSPQIVPGSAVLVETSDIETSPHQCAAFLSHKTVFSPQIGVKKVKRKWTLPTGLRRRFFFDLLLTHDSAGWIVSIAGEEFLPESPPVEVVSNRSSPGRKRTSPFPLSPCFEV